MLKVPGRCAIRRWRPERLTAYNEFVKPYSRGGKQNLVAGGRPCEPVKAAQPKLRERLLVSLHVHCGNGADGRNSRVDNRRRRLDPLWEKCADCQCHPRSDTRRCQRGTRAVEILAWHARPQGALPSDAQSAEEMSSATCLGVPPEIGARASVPKTGPSFDVRASAISSEGETPSKRPLTIPRSRDSGLSAWVEYTRYGSPSQDCRVHDCLATIGEPAVVDGAAPEGDSLEGGRRRPRCPARPRQTQPQAAGMLRQLLRSSMHIAAVVLPESAGYQRIVPEIDSSANAKSSAD